MRTGAWRAVVWCLVVGLGGGQSQGRAIAQDTPAPAQPPTGRVAPTEAERAAIVARLAELDDKLAEVRAKLGEGSAARDLLADVEVCRKGSAWALRFGEFFDPKDPARHLRALARGIERAGQLLRAEKPWTVAEGSVVRGYRSRVDGSVQPYAVVVPGGKPGGGGGDDRLRLDVVLHGRDARIQEARFFDAHDGKPAAEGQAGIVLHVFGRGNNAYRWAGEADVDEAIDAVRRNYWVDDRRVVLRGFSMGGAGAWHLALHEPTRWASVEAGAGFTETVRYAKLMDPTPTVRKGLLIYDAVAYAANAAGVPIVGYGGEKDPQAQASLNIQEALAARGVAMRTEGLVTRAEGIPFERVVGRDMGHAVDAASADHMRAFHDAHAGTAAPEAETLKFVTYTLKYPRVGWLRIHRLVEHYAPATLDAATDRNVATIATKNVAVLAVNRDVGETVRLDGRELPLREAAGGLLPEVYFRRTPDGWETLDHDASLAILNNTRGGKAPGVQGPIDDAFANAFVCVRGTGKPLHPGVQSWVDARLARFAALWAESLRGDLPVVDDKDLADADRDGKHLILFGDPGSNSVLADLLPALPLTWTAETLTLAGATFDPAAHAPALVAANPRNPIRYVVVNSGHTFGTREFAGSNALLYPRLGDRAVIRLGAPDGSEPDAVVLDGYFDERWR